MAERRGADYLWPYISRMLDEAQARKASVEQRAIAVVSSAGVLVSLLVALSTFLLAKGRDAFGGAARLLLIVAAVAFVATAALGVWVNAPRQYQGMTTEDMERMVAANLWQGDAEDAQLLLATQQIQELKTYVRHNNIKGRILQLAVCTEVAGVTMVATAIVVALLSS